MKIRGKKQVIIALLFNLMRCVTGVSLNQSTSSLYIHTRAEGQIHEPGSRLLSSKKESVSTINQKQKNTEKSTPLPPVVIPSKTGDADPYGYWPWILPSYLLPKFIPRGIYRGDQNRGGRMSVNGGFYGGRIENPTQLINTEWGMVTGRGYDDSVVNYSLDGIHGSPFCQISCKRGHFMCQIECVCIVIEHRCNGRINCKEGEDEMQCDGFVYDVDVPQASTVKCDESNNFILCPRTERCVSKRWLCDGEDDCGDFSDETQCESGVYVGYTKNCSENYFQCSNKLCIPKLWLCDNDNDCRDFSDETNCTMLGCSPKEFDCGDGTCISRTWRCDNHLDCLDGSDETGCDILSPECNDDELICNSGKCVKFEFKCDGDDDCEDWSDEYECTSKNKDCVDGEFKCNDGQCLPNRWVCDHQDDCVEGEDELNCNYVEVNKCKPDEYLCPQGHCILKNWVCDGAEDCIYGNDEADCQITCDTTQFACSSPSNHNTSSSKTAFCIPAKHRCDGSKDCPKGEDEVNCPKKRNCEQNTKCHQLCVTFPDGAKGCACHRGYQLAKDGFSCEDVDECSYITDPVCSQNCNNTIGSFKCSCMTGYTLRPDLRTCKALGGAPTLFFANRADLRQMSLSNSRYSLLIKGTHNAIALNYHYEKQLVFWSDITMAKIKKSTIYDSNTTNLVSTGLESPGGIAVDWIHNIIFWTDSGTKRIEVCNLDGIYRAVIAANDLDKPRAIAAHPGEALIFWTDWGPNPKIERAEMDGSNRKSIITQSIFWPNGLTLDYIENQLYWADAKHNVIETALLDGSKRRKIVTKGLPHPFALTIFEDTLFWTDWHTKSITRANKKSGTGYKILHAQILFPMDIQSYHPQRQPHFENHCGESNGGCQHLCLPNQRSFSCACVLGQKLKADKKSCQKPDRFIMFTRKKDIRIKLMEGSNEKYEMVVPVKDIKNVVGFAWDSKSGKIYWSDVNRRSITKAFWNGTDEEDIINDNLVSPYSIAIDWLTDKLYFTDEGNSRIEVCNLSGTIRALLVWENIEKPHDIILDPQKAFMFWSDWGDKPRIERAHMDGTNRIIIVHTNLASPSGLTVDHPLGKLYWADGSLRKISSVNMDGEGRRTILEGNTLQYPFGIDVFENTIYWTDGISNTIERANKLTGKNWSIIAENVIDPMSIRIFHKHRKYGRTSCIFKNGGCSHLCLLKPKGLYACVCPTGFPLLNDQKTCRNSPLNYLIVAHRMYIRQLSLDVPYMIDVILPLKHLKLVTSVDVDRKTGEIYWSDTSEHLIWKSSPDGKKITVLLGDEIESPDGIAIDSAGRKIYWTDGQRHSVEVAELDGTLRKVLFHREVYSPRAITLHYHHGLLFWSDWGKEQPKIEVAYMDGSNRKVIIEENIIWPNGLAIDRPAERLFWNDAKLATIESSDLNGQNRKMIINSVSHPYGLVVVGNHVYWSDWKTEALHRADKETGKDNTIIIKNAQGLMDVRSVQNENIEENACGNNNGGCSHLCLRNPTGFSCACPTGLLKLANGSHCDTVAHTFLLTALRYSINQISFDTEDNWDVTLPIRDDMIGVIEIDFHYKQKVIFYADVTLNLIKSVSLYNLSDVRTIVNENLTSPESIAVDWLADNIYWSNSGHRMIEVSRLDGSYRKIIIHKNLGLVRSVACNPQRGHLYWTNWMRRSSKIERSNSDGSGRRDIIASDLYFPMGLTLDFTNKRLYWIDAKPDDQRIETTDYHGYNRVSLPIEKSHPFSLTQYKDWIYWTDWLNKTILRASKMDGNDKTTIRLLHAALGIKMVSEDKQPGWNPCSIKNGNCPYLCFYQLESYRCPCVGINNTDCTMAPTEKVSNVCPPHQGYDCRIDRDVNEVWFDALHPSFKPVVNESTDVLANTEEYEMGGSHAVIIWTILSLIFVGIIGSGFLWCFLFEKDVKYRPNRNVVNPNYYSSNPGEKNQVDKNQYIWKRFKYDKAQERVFEETICGQGANQFSDSISNNLVSNEPEREPVIIDAKKSSGINC